MYKQNKTEADVLFGKIKADPILIISVNSQYHRSAVIQNSVLNT